MKEKNHFGLLYLVCLSILILNDHVLKYEFPGVVTGKLSDIVGLYCFSHFLFILFPRFKILISGLIILVFSYWKSEFSTPLISKLNLIGLEIDRTIDLTDLLALLVIVLSYNQKYFDTLRLNLLNFRNAIVLCISLFAFTATSYLPRMDPQQTAYRQELLKSWGKKLSEYKFNNSNQDTYLGQMSWEKIQSKTPSPYKLEYHDRAFFIRDDISIKNLDSECLPSKIEIAMGKIYSQSEIELSKNSKPKIIYASINIVPHADEYKLFLNTISICHDRNTFMTENFALKIMKELYE